MFDTNARFGNAPEQVGDLETAPPDYLERTYWWAYLMPASFRIFDHRAMGSAILWGQYRRLSDMVLTRVAPGDRPLQFACLYGDLSQRLARLVGPAGELEIIDVAPIQIANVRRKLAGMDWVRMSVADATTTRADRFDFVLSFFLLHELPDPLPPRCGVCRQLRWHHTRRDFPGGGKPVSHGSIRWLSLSVYRPDNRLSAHDGSAFC